MKGNMGRVDSDKEKEKLISIGLIKEKEGVN